MPFLSYVLLQVKHIHIFIYHPQMNGQFERFNHTLKRILWHLAAEHHRDWDLLLPYILFMVCETQQASTVFTLFEILFGSRPWGLLDVVREAWEEHSFCNTIKHVR